MFSLYSPEMLKSFRIFTFFTCIVALAPYKPYIFWSFQNVGFVVAFSQLGRAYLALQDGGRIGTSRLVVCTNPRHNSNCLRKEGRSTRMEEHLLFQPTAARYVSSVSVFVLPGILPADRRLLLDPVTHTAILLAVEGSDAAPMFSSFQLTPSATTVFLMLLQAYPHYCSYQSLFHSLYPPTLAQDERDQVWERKLAIPPIRRALKALLPALRSFGLQVISLRGQGYVLASADEPARRTRDNAQQSGKTEDADRSSPNRAAGTCGRDGRACH
jgi:hypothetical protein